MIEHAQPNSISTLQVQTTYGTINIYKKGSGAKPLVFLHGSGCDHAMLSWQEVMLVLPEDYTGYAIDLLGYGLSDKPHNLYGVEFYDTHISCVNEVVEQLKLETFTIVGLSMGGAISVGYALSYPNKLKKVFAVNPWGFTKKLTLHRLTYALLHHSNLTVKLFNWVAHSRFLARWFIRYSLIQAKRLITPALVDEVIKACKQYRAGYAMQHFQRSSIGKKRAYPYYSNKLSQLNVPLIFISGDKDTVVPLWHIQEANRLIPNSYLHVLRDCKHWAAREKPKDIVAIIQAYD